MSTGEGEGGAREWSVGESMMLMHKCKCKHVICIHICACTRVWAKERVGRNKRALRWYCGYCRYCRYGYRFVIGHKIMTHIHTCVDKGVIPATGYHIHAVS